MDKKIALLTLLESSFVLTDEEKALMVDALPLLTDEQVEVMGKFLTAERRFLLDHEGDLHKSLEEIRGILEMENQKNTVYVGVGKAN